MSSSYPSRNNPSSRYRSSSSPSRSNYQSENKKQSSSSSDFIYKGGNKKQWAKLHSKINQQLKHENISYILDPAEIARRKIPPPPAIFIPPPLHYIESAADKELRARNQKFEDQNREKAEKKFDEYAEKFPIDFGKGIDVIYQLVSHTIIQDLDSHIEAIRPVTKNAEVQFMAILNRLGVKWGPTSKKDAVEIFRLINSLVGDYRGWDIFLTALKDLIEVLTQTPVRDAANNPVFEPVPIRPHIPHPPPHQPYAVYHAYFAADTAAQVAWDQAHPADRIKNHRPTDDNIKEIVILALADSSFVSYSSLAQRYQQTDHANHTWSDLHRDIESLIQNSARGTSRDPSSLVRPDRHRNTNTARFDQPQQQHRPYPAEQRSVRHDRDHYPTAPDHRDHHQSTAHKRTHSATPSPQDVRAAIQPNPPPAITNTKFPCANCGGDHRSNVCDSTLCTICQATFPTAALRHAHYLSVHKRDSPTKRTRFAEPSNYRSTNTPPTSPFLQSRSARSDDGYASHSSYDSGYDSTASGPGHPPSIGASSDVDEQVQGLYYDVRTVTSVPSLPEPCLPCRNQPTEPQSTNHPPPIPQELYDLLHTDILAHLPPDFTSPNQAPPFTLRYVDDSYIVSHEHTRAERHMRLSPPAIHQFYRRQHYRHLPTSAAHQDIESDSDDDLPDLIESSDDDLNRIRRQRALTTYSTPSLQQSSSLVGNLPILDNDTTSDTLHQPPQVFDIRVATNSDYEVNNTDSDDDDPAPMVPHGEHHIHTNETWHDPTFPHIPFNESNRSHPHKLPATSAIHNRDSPMASLPTSLARIHADPTRMPTGVALHRPSTAYSPTAHSCWPNPAMSPLSTHYTPQLASLTSQCRTPP